MEIIIKFLKQAAIITKISSPINGVFEEKKTETRTETGSYQKKKKKKKHQN